MKNIFITACACMICFFTDAQISPVRNPVRPDTTKNNNRMVATAQTHTVRVAKKLKRGTPVNNAHAIPIIGIDSNATYYTDDPKIINIVNQATKNNIPVDVTLTPMKPCINTENCIIKNTTITQLTPDKNDDPSKQEWYFENSSTKQHPGQELRILSKLQPNRDYLVIIDQNTGYSGVDFFFSISGKIWGMTSPHLQQSLHPVQGKNPITFIIHTNESYKFIASGDEASYISIRPIGNANNMPEKTYQIHFYSIRIKELKL